MRRVYKYHLGIHPRTSIALPVGAKFLHAGQQTHEYFMWFEVDSTALVEDRIFTVHGTGHDITSPYDVWLGTFQDGPYVWHVYESAL